MDSKGSAFGGVPRGSNPWPCLLSGKTQTNNVLAGCSPDCPVVCQRSQNTKAPRFRGGFAAGADAASPARLLEAAEAADLRGIAEAS